MTPTPPPEAEYIRGNPLSPTSPIPVHVSAPHNIPVLENQIDPVFNLMSTHLDHPPLQGPSSGLMSAHQDTSQQDKSIPGQEPLNTSTDPSQEDSSLHFESEKNNTEGSHEQRLRNVQNQPELEPKPLTSISQPSPSIDTLESPHMYTQNEQPPPNPQPHRDANESVSERYPLYRQVPEYATTRSDAVQTARTVEVEPVAHDQLAANGEDPEDVNPPKISSIHTPSAPDFPPSENPIANPAADSVHALESNPGGTQSSLATLPVPISLPARPPPQEQPAMHPNYAHEEDIRSYHTSTALNPDVPLSTNPYLPNSKQPARNGVPSNGIGPPPLATFQQSHVGQPQRSSQTTQALHGDSYGRAGVKAQNSYLEANTNHVRIPEVEKAFDQFLLDEANYTSQGQWERFPQGSRLFVGNLFTEKVSKRDIFYIFSKYGRLAQISMKSAYGFVQYVKAEDCQRAMQSEQGLQIRGRKINLEISKPQKNTRNAAAAIAQGNELRAAYARRSRSPDYGRNGTNRGHGRHGVDRYDHGSGYNDHRGRDEYRPMRSPSPRGMRTHDFYRGSRDRSSDRYHGGRRTRSRSPVTRGGSYRDRSPVLPNPDDEATLPIARRPPGSAPDVQIILAEEVDRTFVGYIQQSFRDRSLRCEVLQMPRVSIVAVVKRQILEGVQAVVKIFRRSQVTGKIPLQVFNRSRGLNDVQFDEYEDLDAATAAEIVVRARSTMSNQPQMQSQNASRPTFGPPQGGHMPQTSFSTQNAHLQQMPSRQPLPGSAPSNVADNINPLDGQALQKLLTSVSQTSQGPQNTQNFHSQPPTPGGPDLAAILSGVSRYQAAPQPAHSQTPYSQVPPQGQQMYQQQAPQNPSYPAFGGLQQHYPQNPPQSQFQASQSAQLGAQPQQANVQEIMAQLARYGQR